MTRINTYQVLGIMVLLVTLDCLGANSVPQLSELLEKYTQSLDSTASMISSYKSSTISSAYLPPMNLNYTNVRMYDNGERRTDGKGRIYHQSYVWGFHTVLKKYVPESKASYSLEVATSHFQYGHNKVTRGQSNGLVTYKETQSPGWNNFRNTSDAFFLGYLGVDVRIDVILKKAKQISVRSEPAIMNGDLCYVIQAETAYGDYVLWLDSAYGYQPIRIEATKDGDDIVNVAALQAPPDKRPDARETLVIDDLTFKQVQEVWIPVKGRVKSRIQWPRHGYYFNNDIRYEITQIKLNPDHDALKSFADPIKHPGVDPELVNDTRVRLGQKGLLCVWRDGKLVDNAGDLPN